jgi:probable HAF family extracellular repeat protein
MNQIRIAICFFIVGQCSVSTGAVFFNLGDLPGGDFYSEASAISADGSTVVGFSKFSGTDGITAVSNADQAFRWSLGSGMVGLGDLTGGAYASRASGVSGDGSVIVGVSSSTPGDQAFRWTLGGGVAGIGDLTGGTFFSRANDVSADGLRIVGVSNSSSGTEAFQYVLGSGMLGLGDLPGDEFRSAANAISDNGLVIVGQSDSTISETDTSLGFSFDEAFRMSISGTMSGLGVTNDPFGCSCIGSGATAASEDGSVVVGWSSDSLFHHAFRWTAADGIASLSGTFLSTSATSSVPLGLSADGSVAVGVYSADSLLVTEPEGGITALPADGDRLAFIWTETAGSKNLQQFLTDDLGLDLTGWTLESATGISADGSVITGYGVNPDGNREAWVVDLNAVPEPNSMLLGLFAGFGVIVRWRVTRGR